MEASGKGIEGSFLQAGRRNLRGHLPEPEQAKSRAFLDGPQRQAQAICLDRAGRVKIQRTRPVAVWMIARADEKGEQMGYFTVGDRRSRAVVPE